jgi:rubrerythrin
MATDSGREAVAATFDRHADEEMEILKRYCAFAEQVEDGPIAFVIERILTEENTHHFLLRTLARWLREPLAGVEERAGPQGKLRNVLLQHTRILQEHELETIDACRSLRSQLAGEEDDLLRTLLDAMALDSAKHQLLLSAVEKMMGA